MISYEDVGGAIELVSREAIERCARSFEGKPMIIRHSAVNPGNMEAKAVGYISRVWCDAPTGWWLAEGVIFDDDAKEKIAKGWSVSCGYHVTKQGAGGVYHAIRYRQEVINFEGEHIAIVETPRYEGATIRLNSKAPQGRKNMNVIKLFKKLVARDNSSGDDAAQAAAAKAAKEKAAKARRDNEAKTEEVEVPADATIEIGGKPVDPTAPKTQQSCATKTRRR